MNDSIHFRFSGMPASPAAEAAARRRARTLRGTHPDALAWEVDVQAPPLASTAGGYGAQVQVRLAGGSRLRAQGCGSDPLAALRLAFNRLEAELGAENAGGVQARAARWLSSVRSRIAQRQDCA
ncbi:MAG TPA: HPF/RaiA family ribosome-associated protein [Ramlibacter sp.]